MCKLTSLDGVGGGLEGADDVANSSDLGLHTTTPGTLVL